MRVAPSVRRPKGKPKGNSRRGDRPLPQLTRTGRTETGRIDSVGAYALLLQFLDHGLCSRNSRRARAAVLRLAARPTRARA